MENRVSLLPGEELLLQQLRQVEFWQNAQAPAEAAGAKVAKDGALPEKWELTAGVELHGWQQEAVERWFAARGRGVMKVVTGAGKTMLALAIIERLQRTQAPELRVVIVVPTVVLLEQWREELLGRSNLPRTAVGLLGGGEDAAFDGRTRIVVAVLNSAARRLPELVRAAGVGRSLLLVVDECHRAGAAEMRRIFQTERAWSLGLSATPERDGDPAGEEEPEAPPVEFSESVLGRELGPVVYELNYAEAIRLGVLPPFGIVHYGLSLRPKESTEYERVSREIKNLRSELERPGRQGLALIRWCRSAASAGNPAAGRLISLSAERKRILFRMEERGNAVARILRDALAVNPATKAILFHESIEEVMRLFARLRAEGLAVVAEHSEFPDQLRATSLRLFRQDIAQVLVSARSLIEGLDIPSADLGIIVAASSSVRQRVQTLGRLLRKSPARAGVEKQAVLHVLYAAKSVDEMIYEKADWEQFVGAERNQYFLWPEVETGPPQRAPGPPRAPSPDECEVDEAALQPRETYPGKLDQGLAFTRDAQGTVRTDEGELIEPHPELMRVLKQSLKGFGRFRVTPARLFVLELEKTPEGWRGVYLGRLTTPCRIVAQEAEAAEARDWKSGDFYPLTRAVGKTFSVLQRDARLLARKTRGEVAFVPPLEAMDDRVKRATVARIQAFLRNAWKAGHKINKVTVTGEGHVVYVWENQARFIDHAPEGAEGFVFEEAGA